MKKNIKIGLGVTLSVLVTGLLITLGFYGAEALANLQQGMKVQKEQESLVEKQEIRVFLDSELTLWKGREVVAAKEIEEIEADLQIKKEMLGTIQSWVTDLGRDIERNICEQAVSKAQIHRMNGESIPSKYYSTVGTFHCAQRFENIPDWLSTESVSERTEIVHRTVLEDIVPAQEWAGGLMDQLDNEVDWSDNEGPWVE